MNGGHLALTKREDGTPIDVEMLKRKSWPGITAQCVQIAGPAIFDFRVDASTNYIALHNLYRADGETFAQGAPRSYSKDLRNKLTYSPSGFELEGWCKIDKAGTIAAVMIDPTASTDRPIDLAQIPPRVEFEDEMLRSVLLRFQAILDDPSLDIPGYVETLAELLAFELNRISSGPRYEDASPGGLTESQVHIVIDYIHDRLGEKITISQMAALLELSRFHFIRCFKKSIGMPPHQFLIRQRIERAKDMLAEPRLSIAEVAERTGFGSSFQLTRAFRRILGTSPTTLRRSNTRRPIAS